MAHFAEVQKRSIFMLGEEVISPGPLRLGWGVRVCVCVYVMSFSDLITSHKDGSVDAAVSLSLGGSIWTV